MSTTTPTLGLTLYDSSTDQVVTFATFRAVWGGTATTSNFYKIDTWAGTVNSSISTLQSQRGAITVSASYISANYYEATVATITAYTTGMTILLKLDTDSAGTVTINISSLGTKSVTKVNSSGTVVNISAGELQSGRYYLFTYDGTQWVWADANSSDQIYILSYVTGNVLTAASDGSIDGTLTQSLLLSQTINSATAKTTLADSDNLGITDSAASNVLKKITWANFKTAIGTALGSIINALTGKTTPVGADVIVIGDSASSFASKLVLLSNLYKSLGTGTQDSTTFLRGDGTFNAPPAGGDSTNYLINGGGDWFQRMTDPTSPTSLTDATYNGMDRFYSLIQGSGATERRDSGIGTSKNSLRLTAGGTTNRYGKAQIVESYNSIAFRNKSVIAELKVKPTNNSGSGTRDYRIAILEWTGTADSVTKDVVNDWTSSTYTTGNFFASTTLTLVGTASVTATHGAESTLSVTGTVSSSCNNLIVFFWTEDVPSHASDYANFGEIGVYVSSSSQVWKPRPVGEEFDLCCRYCEKVTTATQYGFFSTAVIISSTEARGIMPFQVRKRGTLSVSLSTASTWMVQDGLGGNFTGTAVGSGTTSDVGVYISVTTGGTMTVGAGFIIDNGADGVFAEMIIASEL